MSQFKIERIDQYRYRIPKQGKALVDGMIYASEALFDDIEDDDSLRQVVNVSHLPGIVKNSIAMPDIHSGYGFPIGGVAAFDMKEGVISPGGVGYDINCGVRLMRSNLYKDDIMDKIGKLVNGLFENIPTGLGSHRKDMKLSDMEMREVCYQGAKWAIDQGFGYQEDLEYIEEKGAMEPADDSNISAKAFKRGNNQLGTLGSGNHFIELSYVSEVYDRKAADQMGLSLDHITVSVHTGSRGFGYQICDDYIKEMDKAARKYGFELPDRQLCCAPVSSKEGRQYLGAMGAAANFAFCNRQIISHWVRETFEKYLKISPKDHDLRLVYDVAHNMAKIEDHLVDGKKKKLCVHRKGATRAFPPNHPDIPKAYQEIGQPVLVPGDMGRYSYVLVGSELAFGETFGSCCHGAGRVLSRHKAKKLAKGRKIEDELRKKNIIVKAKGRGTLDEEMPDAYKDVNDVVNVVDGAGLAKKIVQLRPLGVIKG